MPPINRVPGHGGGEVAFALVIEHVAFDAGGLGLGVLERGSFPWPCRHRAPELRLIPTIRQASELSIPCFIS